MSQQSRPIADVGAGNWEPAPLYEQLNQASPGDSQYISVANPDQDSFEVRLAPLFWPGEGEQILTVRLQRADEHPADVLIELLQGSTTIAQTIAQPGSEFSDVVLTLSPEQIAQITNYADLRVRVTGGCIEGSGSGGSGSGSGSTYPEGSGSGSGGSIGSPVTVPCCGNLEIPSVLTMTFTPPTGCASGAIPSTATLTYTENVEAYGGFGEVLSGWVSDIIAGCGGGCVRYFLWCDNTGSWRCNVRMFRNGLCGDSSSMDLCNQWGNDSDFGNTMAIECNPFRITGSLVIQMSSDRPECWCCNDPPGSAGDITNLVIE